MDVRGILLVGAAAPGTEQFAGHPIAALDVLGKPAVERIAERMHSFGIEAVSVICESEECQSLVRGALRHNSKLKLHQLPPDGLWRACEEIFSNYAQEGAEIILVQRVGAYLEVDFDHLLQFHLDSKSRVTPVIHEDRALDLFVISASRRNDAAFLFRHELKALRSEAVPYRFTGYANRLESIGQLRRLAHDALFQRNQIRPEGSEIRPGIWAGPYARIEPGARIVAPAYIGARAKVRTAAVVTRASALEHHAVVDCGTVVEDSTLLPFAFVGAGLDLASSVVGFDRLASLRRQVEVEIPDRRLIGMAPASATRRAAGSLVALAGAVARGVLPLPRKRNVAVGQTTGGIPAAASLNVQPAEKKPAGEMHVDRALTDTPEQDLVLLRRYGSH